MAGSFEAGRDLLLLVGVGLGARPFPLGGGAVVEALRVRRGKAVRAGNWVVEKTQGAGSSGVRTGVGATGVARRW